MAHALRVGVASGLLAAALGCPGSEAPPEDASERPADPASTATRCEHHDDLRNVFWGELHVHTGLSGDAFRSNVRTTPDDAYRFARGEPIRIPAPDAQSEGPTVQLDRPLDFVAVTDHAETFGLGALCQTPGRPEHDSEACDFYRRLPATPALPADPDLPPRDEVYALVCGEDGARCIEAQTTPWEATVAAAAHWNGAAPECPFTTFVAYEWSGARGGPLLHRNVIFRNEQVAAPVSSHWNPRPWDLFRRLQSECLEAGTGCDVLAIPHNSNTSQGQMFALDYPGAVTASQQADFARQQAALEPLVEIMQHKGESECRNGFADVLGGADELCGFEKLFPPQLPECRPDSPRAMNDVFCSGPGGFARYGLGIGLGEARRIGANPFQFGFVAATDAHNANAGQADEWGWQGHLGSRDASLAARLGGRGRSRQNNPGGLAAVWAEENSRESLFQALRRRETYGTSGPRLRVRFFGGWGYAEELCAASDFAARGYAGGVPMGGSLPAAPDRTADPVFALQALRDPGTPGRPGGLLQRAQIVKVTSEGGGRVRQQVFDVAGDPANAADVDPASCTPRGPGADRLCAVWRDPDFDPEAGAVYYARVLENPSCRWDQLQCLARDPASRPAGCEASLAQDPIQERAWTSPIWYEPPGSALAAAP